MADDEAPGEDLYRVGYRTTAKGAWQYRNVRAASAKAALAQVECAQGVAALAKHWRETLT